MNGPPVVRHAAAVGLMVVLLLVFWRVQGQMEPVHRWNRTLADTSLALLCFILVLGPISRYVPAVRAILPWRRELGIGMFVAASLHFAVYLDSVYNWNPLDFFIVRDRRTGDIELNRGSGSAANWVGAVALVYSLVLAGTSNRFSQRRLGRGWKFVQQQVYTLFVVAILHVAGWLYLGYQTPGSFELWLWSLAGVAALTQFAGYIRTVRSSKAKSRDRIPAGVREMQSSDG